MGGIGSTRLRDHPKAPLIEDAHQLDVATLEPALKHDQITGSIQWTNDWAEVIAEISFSLGPTLKSGMRHLMIDPGGDSQRQSVQLERAQRGWHSEWLFRCPIDCGRRSRKLYALPEWMTFMCRSCGGLTYRSVQQHDSRLDLARRDPLAFIQSRARAPKTDNSRMVTAWLVMDAQENWRPGRGWGRKSTTLGTRLLTAMRQDFIDRWGFPPEDAGRIANGGQMPERPSGR